MRIYLFTCFLLFQYSMLIGKDFNILDFGAVADRVTLNTTHIQSAIDAAHKEGGGRVIIPAGYFLSGSIIIRSGVELHVMKGGVLLGSTDPVHYRKLNRWIAFILADSEKNIAITGHGVIDGQGRELALHIDSLFYAGKLDTADYNLVEMRPMHYIRPQLVEFVNCSHIRIHNITMKNAACWVQTYDKCNHLVMDSVRVDSDAYWNNDGIDVQDCKNVRITNCIINSSDDGICLKSQSPQHYCDSIYIANCRVRSSSNAIKFGTVSLGGFKNVVIENIEVYFTFRSVVAIECVDGGFLENIRIENIKGLNVGNPIFIKLGKRPVMNKVGTLKNIILKNFFVIVSFERTDYGFEIRGPSLPFFHNPFPSSITGIPGHLVENVVLEDIKISYPGRGNKGMAYMPLSRLDDVPENEGDYPEFSMFGELPSWGFYVRHVKGLQMKNVEIGIDKNDYRPAMVFDDVMDLDFQSLMIHGDNKPAGIVLYKTGEVSMDKAYSILKM